MRRVLSVHFAPCALFVAGVLALVRAGSFSGRSDWAAVVPQRSAAVLGLLVMVVAGAALLGLLLQPFQVRAVRVLEGYWDRWPVTARLAGMLIGIQRRRWQALRNGVSTTAETNATTKRVRADAARRLYACPPVDALMPTALGNALRAGELKAGERYGLSTLASWPSLHMQVSDRAAVVLYSTRDALDAAVNLCWCFLALIPVSCLALYDEPGLWWTWACEVLLAAAAYKGAVTAAQTYASLMHVMYDLHRFDLAKALHYSLPADPQSERELFAQVSDLLSGRGLPDLQYEHPGDWAKRPGSS
ncbi:hypothetical protein [Streptomyces chartreusis]|uniref:hypothetical protein n=1 Tax=Streptomyces chartreusis TaxID=1969 RepID=UPI0033E3021B